jgi:amidase
VFRSLGATVEEVDLGWGDEVLKAGMAYLEHLFGASLSQLLDEHGKDMTSYARQFAEDGQKSKATDFVATLEVAARMYQTLGPLLETYDVLICPTNALPSVSAEFDHTRDSVEINGKQVNPSLGWVMTTPFNMLSRCPVLSIPSGRAASGVPTGIQIVGRTFCDADVFRAALAYETAQGQWFSDAETRPSL